MYLKNEYSVFKGHPDFRPYKVSLTRILRFRVGLVGALWLSGVGLDADAVLIDPGRAWTITAHSLRYLNPFSAFEGLEGVGLPVCTVVRGRVVAREGNVLAPFGHGLFQPRKP